MQEPGKYACGGVTCLHDPINIFSPEKVALDTCWQAGPQPTADIGSKPEQRNSISVSLGEHDEQEEAQERG